MRSSTLGLTRSNGFQAFCSSSVAAQGILCCLFCLVAFFLAMFLLLDLRTLHIRFASNERQWFCRFWLAHSLVSAFFLIPTIESWKRYSQLCLSPACLVKNTSLHSVQYHADPCSTMFVLFLVLPKNVRIRSSILLLLPALAQISYWLALWFPIAHFTDRPLFCFLF